MLSCWPKESVGFSCASSLTDQKIHLGVTTLLNKNVHY